jgi:hypothetical protein
MSGYVLLKDIAQREGGVFHRASHSAKTLIRQLVSAGSERPNRFAGSLKP